MLGTHFSSITICTITIKLSKCMNVILLLPDATMIGHVDSWTSGEDFCQHLLHLRGLRENSQGWTVTLQEEMDYYELMGHDYVLDLVSEMEIPPGFPVCNSHFLVSSDRTRESPSLQRAYYQES